MIHLSGVSFTYPDKEHKSLTNINLKINRGEFIVLCGPSGCGKTSITRLINGLIPHFFEGILEGKVEINNRDIRNITLNDIAANTGSVFQNPRSQFFNTDTNGELVFSCENMGLPSEEIFLRFKNTVQEFNIHKLLNRSIFKLSGGEKQKIICAAVSICGPDIMVLDEPSSNLDALSTEDLRKILFKWKSEGKTVIIAEHRLHFLRDLADRFILMDNTTVKKEFTSEEFLSLKKDDISKLGLRSVFFDVIPYKKEKEKEKNKSNDIILSDFIFSYTLDTQILNIPYAKIPENSITAIVGNNGAGKSTLARCICGLEQKFKGTIAGLSRKQCLKHCFMVMQNVNHQLFTGSVIDEVLLSMDENNYLKAEEILTSLGLLHLKDMHPMSLSEGEKQRTAIAGAVASNRQIIVFDEPTSGLDLKHMKEVALLLKKLKENCKTIFVITHDLELIRECCTYVVHLENGRIVDKFELDTEGYEKVKPLLLVALAI